MFNYIGTFNKPTAISKSITCSFTEPYPKKNIILVKSSFLEIYNVKNESLEFFISHNVFGSIIILEKIIEEKGSKTDNLFILNESLDYCIINFNNQTNGINIIAKGEIRESIGKIRNKILYTIDKNFKFILLSPYKSIFRIIFLHSTEREKNEGFKINMNYDEILYLFNLNKNFPLKDLDVFLEENKEAKAEAETEKNNFAFDFKNMENILNTNSYGYRNLMGVGNRQVFQVIKQKEALLKEEKKASISYYDNSKVLNLKNNANFSSDLFAIVKLSNNYTNAENTNLNNQNENASSSANFNRDKQVVTMEPFLIDFQNKELKKIFKISFEIESLKDSNFMFSPRIGGVLIFFSDEIEYYEILSNKIQKCNSIIKNNYLKTPFPSFEDYAEIDLHNYILYDKEGEMFLFNMNIINKYCYSNNNFQKTNQNEFEFFLIPLGSLNYISSISYVEKNLFFIGSDKSNSFYVKLNNVYSFEYINNNKTNNNQALAGNHFRNNKKKLKETKDYFEILEEYENLAPITNFLVLNDSKNNHNFTDINTEILCVCGVGKYTTLKSIRKGRSCIQDAELPFIPGDKVFSIEVDLEVNYYNACNDYSSNLYDNNLRIVEDYNQNVKSDSDRMIIDDCGFDNSKNNVEKLNAEFKKKEFADQILIFIWYLLF